MIDREALMLASSLPAPTRSKLVEECAAIAALRKAGLGAPYPRRTFISRFATTLRRIFNVGGHWFDNPPKRSQADQDLYDNLKRHIFETRKPLARPSAQE